MTYANMTALSLKIARTCSQCGNVGHNARTCTEQNTIDSTAKTNNNNNNNNSSIMLFGVRLTPMESSPSPCSSASSSSSFRKCMSMNNLAQYEQQQQQHHEGQQLPHYSGGDVGGSGYASDDGHASGIRNRERKKGVPWTEEEHKLFLVGLNQVGKGDWRGISRNFVKTKTPTQVASHAQKYFLRRTNLNRRRRRSSLFDITTDTISRSASAGQLNNLDTTLNSKQAPNQAKLFSSPCPSKLPPILTNHANTTSIVTMPPSSLISNLNIKPSHTSPPPKSSIVINTNMRERELEPFLSLSLSQGPSNEEQTQPSNTFEGFNGNDKNTVRVA